MSSTVPQKLRKRQITRVASDPTTGVPIPQPTRLSSWAGAPDLEYPGSSSTPQHNLDQRGRSPRTSVLVTMASAYHGGIPLPDGDDYVDDPAVYDALKRAMDYWFAHGYTNEACIEFGGLSQCPCGTPGL